MRSSRVMPMFQERCTVLPSGVHKPNPDFQHSTRISGGVVPRESQNEELLIIPTWTVVWSEGIWEVRGITTTPSSQGALCSIVAGGSVMNSILSLEDPCGLHCSPGGCTVHHTRAEECHEQHLNSWEPPVYLQCGVFFCTCQNPRMFQTPSQLPLSHLPPGWIHCISS